AAVVVAHLQVEAGIVERDADASREFLGKRHFGGREALARRSQRDDKDAERAPATDQRMDRHRLRAEGERDLLLAARLEALHANARRIRKRALDDLAAAGGHGTLDGREDRGLDDAAYGECPTSGARLRVAPRELGARHALVLVDERDGA